MAEPIPTHKERPVTIPELTHALRACYQLLEERGEGSTMFTLPLKGLIERAEAQVPPCPTCGGSGNDPDSRWLHEQPCPACSGSGARP